MRHTVIGLFDTYTSAENARDTLVQTGFARTDIELQANPEPRTRTATGMDPTVEEDTGGHGFMANIERFLSSLFASGPRQADPATTARYTDAVRHGAVLVCISAASESHAELAHRTLAKLGAVDIGERAPNWDSPMAGSDSARDHSILDELGIGAVASVPPAASRPMPERTVPPAATQSQTQERVYPPAGAPQSFGQEGAFPPAGTQSQSQERTYLPQGVKPMQERAVPPSSTQSPMRDRDFPSSSGRAPMEDRMTPPPAAQPPMEDSFTPPPASPPPVRDRFSQTSAAVRPQEMRDPLDPLGPMDPARVQPRDQPPLADTPMTNDPATRAVATGAAPGSGAYMAPGTSPGTSPGASPAASTGGIGAPMPDEFLDYEEDFRGHYDEKYAQEGARYEDYSGAYHYGAKMGLDVRYRDRQWDEIEPEVRRDWETTPHGHTWERFKAAVRHGWDRVTGHHHV